MSARVHMRQHADGLHVAAIDINTAMGALRVTGVGGWFGDALSAATSVVNRIASDPVVNAILPPQASLALNAVRKLANAAQSPSPVAAIRQVAQQYEGPGIQRLASTLLQQAAVRPADPAVRAFARNFAPPMRRGEVPARAMREQERAREADEQDDDEGGDE